MQLIHAGLVGELVPTATVAFGSAEASSLCLEAPCAPSSLAVLTSAAGLASSQPAAPSDPGSDRVAPSAPSCLSICASGVSAPPKASLGGAGRPVPSPRPLFCPLASRDGSCCWPALSSSRSSSRRNGEPDRLCRASKGVATATAASFPSEASKRDSTACTALHSGVPCVGSTACSSSCTAVRVLATGAAAAAALAEREAGGSAATLAGAPHPAGLGMSVS
mmetsp:Transcript_21001/g.66309  ORF Transcript_21001/g.66309 Transcript_21001/m.66309 type:complete len:221 (-) Transcript_21001:890-1552(-)